MYGFQTFFFLSLYTEKARINAPPPPEKKDLGCPLSRSPRSQYNNTRRSPLATGCLEPTLVLPHRHHIWRIFRRLLALSAQVQ